MSAAHYFVFSHAFQGNARLCGECHRAYDAGAHIEITTLAAYARYVCPSGGGRGHSSIYTGAHLPSLRTLHEHLCVCGQEFVKEDGESWRLSWEMETPGTGWHAVSVVRSRHVAETQRRGLQELADQGASIRGIELDRLAVVPWERSRA